MIVNAVDRRPSPPPDPRNLSSILRGFHGLPARGTLTEQELQGRVGSLLGFSGCTRSLVTVTLVEGATASAIGGCSNTLVAWGTVSIGRALMTMLSADEIDFVLAHEVMHIRESHLAARLHPALLRVAAEVVAVNDPLLRMLLGAYDASKLTAFANGRLPLVAALVREQELQADAGAVRLVGRKSAAVSALTKLVDDDLNRPSHTWEALDIVLPVMSMRERVAWLHHTFPDWP